MEIEKRKWKFSALASLVCIGQRDHFLCKFQIVSNDNQIRFLNLDIQYLPYVLRNENWKCLLHERREIFLGLLLNSHPHGFYRIQTTRNKKCPLKSVKFRFSKGHLNRDFVSLYFIHIAPLYQAATFFVRISCDVWMKRWEANSHVARLRCRKSGLA